MPLLLSREFKYVTLVVNGGIDTPIHDHDRETTGIFGFGLGRAFARKIALMGEVRGESTLDLKRDRLASASAGMIYGVRNVIWYVRLGHSLFGGDARHLFIAAGIKKTIETSRPRRQDGA